MPFFVVNNGTDQIAVEASSPDEAKQLAAEALGVIGVDLSLLGLPSVDSQIAALTVEPLRTIDDLTRFFGDDPRFIGGTAAENKFLREATGSTATDGPPPPTEQEGPAVVGLPAADADGDAALLEEIFGFPLPAVIANNPEAITALLTEFLAGKQAIERAGIFPPPDFTSAQIIEQIKAGLPEQFTFEQEKLLAEIRAEEDPAVKERLALQLANDLSRTVIDSNSRALIANIQAGSAERIAAIQTGTPEQRLAEITAKFGTPEGRALIARGGLSPQQVLAQSAIEGSPQLFATLSQILGNPSALGTITAAGGVGAVDTLAQQFDPFNVFRQAQEQGIFDLGGVPTGAPVATAQPTGGQFFLPGGRPATIDSLGNVVEGFTEAERTASAAVPAAVSLAGATGRGRQKIQEVT